MVWSAWLGLGFVVGIQPRAGLVKLIDDVIADVLDLYFPNGDLTYITSGAFKQGYGLWEPKKDTGEPTAEKKPNAIVKLITEFKKKYKIQTDSSKETSSYKATKKPKPKPIAEKPKPDKKKPAASKKKPLKNKEIPDIYLPRPDPTPYNTGPGSPGSNQISWKPEQGEDYPELDQEYPWPAWPDQAQPNSQKPGPIPAKPEQGLSKPAPDSGKPTPNSGKPAPDSGKPAPDSGKPTPSSGKPAPDLGKPTPSSGKPAPDSGKPASDSGKPNKKKPGSSKAKPKPAKKRPAKSEPSKPKPAPVPEKSGNKTPKPKRKTPKRRGNKKTIDDTESTATASSAATASSTGTANNKDSKSTASAAASSSSTGTVNDKESKPTASTAAAASSASAVGPKYSPGYDNSQGFVSQPRYGNPGVQKYKYTIPNGKFPGYSYKLIHQYGSPGYGLSGDQYVIPDNGQPGSGQPSGNQPTGSPPSDKQPGNQQPDGSGQPDDKRPGGKQSVGEQPTGKKPGGKQPDDKQQSGEQPDDIEPADKQPSGGRQGSNQPGGRKPGGRQPGDRQPGDRQPGNAPSHNEQPGNRQPTSGQPDRDQPDVDQPGYISQYSIPGTNTANTVKRTWYGSSGGYRPPYSSTTSYAGSDVSAGVGQPGYVSPTDEQTSYTYTSTPNSPTSWSTSSSNTAANTVPLDYPGSKGDVSKTSYASPDSSASAGQPGYVIPTGGQTSYTYRTPNSQTWSSSSSNAATNTGYPGSSGDDQKGYKTTTKYTSFDLGDKAGQPSYINTNDGQTGFSYSGPSSKTWSSSSSNAATNAEPLGSKTYYTNGYAGKRKYLLPGLNQAAATSIASASGTEGSGNLLFVPPNRKVIVGSTPWNKLIETTTPVAEIVEAPANEPFVFSSGPWTISKEILPLENVGSGTIVSGNNGQGATSSSTGYSSNLGSGFQTFSSLPGDKLQPLLGSEGGNNLAYSGSFGDGQNILNAGSSYSAGNRKFGNGLNEFESVGNGKNKNFESVGTYGGGQGVLNTDSLYSTGNTKFGNGASGFDTFGNGGSNNFGYSGAYGNEGYLGSGSAKKYDFKPQFGNAAIGSSNAAANSDSYGLTGSGDYSSSKPGSNTYSTGPRDTYTFINKPGMKSKAIGFPGQVLLS